MVSLKLSDRFLGGLRPKLPLDKSWSFLREQRTTRPRSWGVYIQDDCLSSKKCTALIKRGPPPCGSDPPDCPSVGLADSQD